MSLDLPSPPLRDGGLYLREPVPGDVPALVRGCRDPLVQSYTWVPSDYGSADAEDFVLGAAGRRRRRESIELVVAEDPDALPIGAIGVVMHRYDPARGEVGYWVAAEARGRGIASRALGLLSGWALGPAGLERLELTVAVANAASWRVAERCGFRREGVMRDAWPRGPRRQDMFLYSLLPGDLAR